MKHTTFRNTVRLVTISVLSALLAVFIFSRVNPKTEVVIQKQEPLKQYASLPVSPAINTDFTQAAAMAVDAVVHVTVIVETEAYAYGNPFLEFFFGEGSQPKTYKREQMGSGSGVIISTDGYIVTNNHVIDNSTKIKVKFNDNREFTASLVGSDPVTDIALIKLDDLGDDDVLPTLSFGNSETLKVGEWVLAVGNPFSLSTTVTAGIVSAKGRNMYNMHSQQSGKISIESFIQTDAAVNPGNSGGALVNTNGELIGINTAIASPTGTYAGYAFAVPSTIVKKVVADLMEYGEVKRAFIGVSISDINKELAEEKGLSTLKGAYVGGVSEHGAGKEAGLEANDVITKVNGVNIGSMSELQEQVSRYRPGDKITVTALRGEKEHTFELVLRDQYGNEEVIENDALAQLGIEVVPIDEKTQWELGINGGLQVTSLKNGKLKSKGVRSGYVITKVNNQPIKSVEDLVGIINRIKDGLFLTGVYPDGKVAYYAINMNE